MSVTYGEYPDGGIRATVGTDEGPKEYLIPADPANRDYARYLEWVQEGNTAEQLEDPIKRPGEAEQ